MAFVSRRVSLGGNLLLHPPLTWKLVLYFSRRSRLLLVAADRFVTIEVDGDSEENQNPKARPEDG